MTVVCQVWFNETEVDLKKNTVTVINDVNKGPMAFVNGVRLSVGDQIRIKTARMEEPELMYIEVEPLRLAEYQGPTCFDYRADW